MRIRYRIALLFIAIGLAVVVYLLAWTSGASPTSTHHRAKPVTYTQLPAGVVPSGPMTSPDYQAEVSLAEKYIAAVLAPPPPPPPPPAPVAPQPAPVPVYRPPTTTTTQPPARAVETPQIGSSGGWNQVAICEEGGSNSPEFGYFGIMPSSWGDFDGYPLAGDAPWSVQVERGDQINGGGPPWAPAGCAAAGYHGW